MHVFEVVIALLLAGAGLAALARRMAIPYPALVALAGAALALVPGAPSLVLDPELALALFVAPVLLDAAFDSSPRDLRANWRSVASLALGAVAITVVAVALVARALVPGMPWAAAIALGAVVAPPDAAAATAVLRQLRPPHRLLVILEGESLFNDASALLVYRLAVGAALAGAWSGWTIVPLLLTVTVGSVVLGVVLSRVTLAVIPRVRDVATAVIIQFCSTFAVWLLAERLHLSGILTMVVYAMVTARRAAEVVPARLRIPSYAVWEVAVFVLNVLAFILVGLQLKSILARLDAGERIQYTVVAVAVCAVAILARVAWVTGTAALGRWWCRARPGGKTRPPSGLAVSPRAALLMSWCGMRGIVTLAAALALPTVAAGGERFPYRDLILFTAFAVVVGTLVAQGMTLRWVMKRLGLGDDGEVEREVRLARIDTLRVGLAAASAAPPGGATALLRRRYELLLGRVVDGDGTGEHVPAADADSARAAAAAVRRRLAALRAEGTIGDAAFQQVEQQLDWAEMDLEQFLAGIET